MTTERTNQTTTLKDSQVRSKPDSYIPYGGHALPIHLCCYKVQYDDDLNGSFDQDSDGFQ